MEDHFLNNLLAHLNSISRIAARENASETQKLIRKVIENIRYKTTRQGQILTIEDELKAVSNLIEIYGLRFGDVLKFSLTAQPSCLNYYIPHYSIMTFAENSLFHAFEETEDVRRISICVEKEGDLLRILICDNGSGFDTGNILCIKQNEREAENKYGTIHNTVTRISNYFKSKDTVNVTSKKG